MYTTQGTITVIYDTQSFKSDFTKREFVVKTEGKYPQDLKFEFTKDKCQVLNSYNEGDEVEVSFDVRGNEYNGKYYVNLSAWKIEHIGAQQDQKSAPIPTANTLKEEMPNFDEMDSIPF